MGKVKFIMITVLVLAIQEYQFPMGKVKLRMALTSPSGKKASYQFPMGKVKLGISEKEFLRLLESVSIPNGKGKDRRRMEQYEKEIIRINSQWER